VLGIAFHSLIDGVIYSVTFNVSILTGTLAAIGMVFHEFPEGVVTFALLDENGWDRRKSILYALLAAALSTPLGALLSYPFIRRIEQQDLGALLALSAGVLIYVGASHLLPSIQEEKSRSAILALAAGVLVAGIVILVGG
jgi:zinc transporter ZupT